MDQTARPDAAVAEFWDQMYLGFDHTAPAMGPIELPAEAQRLHGQHVLIVACGTGKEVVRACREAASTTAIDISQQAVDNARAMVHYNGLNASYVVADASQSGLPSESFDIIWGSAVLHHLKHDEVAAEFSRLLKPGGIVYMMSEPTFFNPLLRFGYETAFGKGRVGRRRKFLFFTRIGDEFEKPIDHADLAPWLKLFEVKKQSRGFMFVEKFGHVFSKNVSIRSAFKKIDEVAETIFPFLKNYGYEYNFTFTKRY
jgi:ubiquinone/menaquinone biosynthesis C-methylase UbiE